MLPDPTPDPGEALVVRRTIRAPRERVFRAWTTPEDLRVWWRTSPAHTPALAEIDLRPGGAWRLGMTGPSGATYVATGVFRVVEPPLRLVYTWRWVAPEPASTESLVTVEFHESAGATEVVVSHAGLPDAAVRRSHGEGWTACATSLARLLESADTTHKRRDTR